MRYKIGDQEIRSENSAKPVSQGSGYLLNLLRERGRTASALDYGCGKLRYTQALAMRSRHIGVVDSAIQLYRQQIICGQLTTVSDYVADQWPSSSVHTIEQFLKGVRDTYDFVLCANVLSAIPSPEIRMQSLRAIRGCLTSNGVILVANQHYNSYFRSMSSAPDSKKHLDGWIRPSRRGASYYGLLTPERTDRLLREAGFVANESWIHGQSNYVLAGREEA